MTSNFISLVTNFGKKPEKGNIMRGARAQIIVVAAN